MSNTRKVNPATLPCVVAALPCPDLQSVHGRRVLVADDSAVNRKVALRTLQTFGCSVTVVSNGKEAVEAIAAASYDLVLLDCHMPEMDGFSAAQHIRSIAGPAGRVPIIALTASASAEDRAKCIEVGMNAVLPKPLPPEALLEALRQWVADIDPAI